MSRAAPRLLATLALAAAGCTTGAALFREADSIQNQLDAAREAGAYRCAPKALALAEAHLEFLKEELSQGNAVRAAEHRAESSAALVTVMARVKTCPPLVGDADGDGLLDDRDACVKVPGKPEFMGCPDSDGDGLPDPRDRCPAVAEDADGVDDDDGCPEDEDSDDDGLLDPEDACPHERGPRALRGCPDSDGDGLADGDDRCPNAAGLREHGGCPDSDGDGVLDGEDRCPKVPGAEENRGCPYGDQDTDGVLDKDDRCPDVPEDPDGFEDADGCPDADNDGDGIVDGADRCPLALETMNGVDDEDGCPDQKLELVEVNRELGKIEIKQKVFFATGKATIQPVSFRLLDEVAEVLKTYPTMQVMVEGHTDAVGSASKNLRLSQDRADAVRVYLVGKGVPPERLTAMGFGKERPLESNQTKAGREVNRRVEFTITKE
jgi:OOP family OmpA-OmpF porin